MGVYIKRNRYMLDYYLPNGKRKRKSYGRVDSCSRRDAEKALKIIRSEMYKGEYGIQDKKKPISLKKFITEEYLTWAVEHHDDYSRDKSCCKHFLEFFKSDNLKDINKRLFQKYISWRKSKGIKNRTLNRERTVINILMNKAVEWEFLDTNPLAGLKKLKEQPIKYKKFKDWEFKKLYLSADKYLKPILKLAFLTGMRRDEIRKLKWEEVDFEEKLIFVIETKNNDNRVIPMDDELFNLMEELRNENNSEYVILKEDGLPYKSRKSWDGRYKKALEKSGIEYRTFHELRRTFISNLKVDEKEDDRTVMNLSGHKDIRMMKVYGVSDMENMRNAMDKIGNRYKKIFNEEDIFLEFENFLKINNL